MGTPAINGRQAWVLIWNEEDGKSAAQKIHGLDYSPKTINLRYIQSHPELISQLGSTINVKKQAEVVSSMAWSLGANLLKTVLGPLVFLLFLLGLLALMKRKRYYEILVILGFIGVSVLGPLNHDVSPIYISPIAPLMMLLAGMGIVYLSEVIVGREVSS